MQVYTPHNVRNLQSQLHIETNVHTRSNDEYPDNRDYSQCYFQILIFRDSEDPGRLVYGMKKDLVKKYSLDPLSFPTKGIEVNQDFLNKGHASYPTVRFLLQCRKLSQIMSSTWIDQENIVDSEKYRTKLIKKIFDSYNIVPDTFWLNRNGELTLTQDIEIHKNILSIQKDKDNLSSFLIQSTHIGYNSISLALLLSGQAYYKDEQDNWKTVCDPIFSIYETIWEYALDISWDTFYAYRTDLSQAGGQQKPPFTKVTLGYPPRPNQFSLKQENIKKWVTADENYSDDNPYPFYPEENSSDWKNQQLQFVQPPYPYLPLSSS